MRFAVVACRVFTRELSYAVSQCPNTCIVYWMEQGLHNTPARLRENLQGILDQIERENEQAERKFDAILLGYGLCSNGTAGLAARTIPLVVPRVDDCMALFLGSQERYLELFHAHKGVYWFNSGWVEVGQVPSKARLDAQLARYIEIYGEDNAQFLMETESAPLYQYDTCLYIESPVYQSEELRRHSKACAADFGWNFQPEPGSQRYFDDLLAGNWEDTRFLICPLGSEIEASGDEKKLRAVCRNG